MRFALTSVFSLLFLFSISAFGQVKPNNSFLTTSDKLTADEDFELNITQKRITENDFSRSTQVELSDNNRGGLRLEVGVGVKAESIDVWLRGISGNVRFRASLEPLRRRLEEKQITTIQDQKTPRR